MLVRKSFLISASMLLLSVCWPMNGLGQGNDAVHDSDDDAPSCFTLASVKGYYAVLGTYGANVALAMGERYFDGSGNMTGVFTLNEPVAGSTTGERKVVTGTQKGTYTINCDGSGVITRTVTSGTTVVQQMDNFQITKAT